MAERVAIGASWDGREAERGLRQLSDQLDRIDDKRVSPRIDERGMRPAEQGVKRLNVGLLGLAKSAAAVALPAAGVTAFAVAARNAVDNASDLNESISATRATFRGSGEDMLRWSRTAATALGMTRQQALQATTQLGAMLIPMGFADREAAAMSQRMAQLATDMASFNNEDPTEMLDRIRAGLAGESEPLRRYGVDLRVAALEQQAVKDGLIQVGEKLQGNTMIQAAYNKIIADTRRQHGDFNRTSEGLANQQRILAAQVRETSGAFGQILLPAATKTVRFLNREVVPGVRSFADELVKTWERPGITPEEKFRESWEKLEATGLPKATQDAILGGVADMAGKMPETILEALERAPWAGKAVIAALLIKKFGPAFSLVGGRLGTALGTGAAGGGGLAGRAGPVPVFVTNAGALGGGPGGIARAAGGAAAASRLGGGLVGTVGAAGSRAGVARLGALVGGAPVTTAASLVVGGMALNDLQKSGGLSKLGLPSDADARKAGVRASNAYIAAWRAGGREWQEMRARTFSFADTRQSIQEEARRATAQFARGVTDGRGRVKRSAEEVAEAAIAPLRGMARTKQQIARKQMVDYAAQLERSGTAPAGTTARLVKRMKDEYGVMAPALKRSVDNQVIQLGRLAQQSGVKSKQTRDAIQAMYDTYRRIAAGFTGGAAADVNTGLDRVSRVTRHTGGVLPGPDGKEILVQALPGETVLTRHQKAALEQKLGPGAVDQVIRQVKRHHSFDVGGTVPGAGLSMEVPKPRIAGSDATARLGNAMIDKAHTGLSDKLQRLIASFTAPSGGGAAAPAQVRAWLTTALRFTGRYSPANLEALIGRAMQESGGNPRAINLWDSNAKAGIPSKGLLQTIDPTFQSYRDRRLPNDVYNPIANAVAAINYMYARYGHIVGPSSTGYHTGGVIPQFHTGGTIGPRMDFGNDLAAYNAANPNAQIGADPWGFGAKKAPRGLQKLAGRMRAFLRNRGFGDTGPFTIRSDALTSGSGSGAAGVADVFTDSIVLGNHAKSGAVVQGLSGIVNPDSGYVDGAAVQTLLHEGLHMAFRGPSRGIGNPDQEGVVEETTQAMYPAFWRAIAPGMGSPPPMAGTAYLPERSRVRDLAAQALGITPDRHEDGSPRYTPRQLNMIRAYLKQAITGKVRVGTAHRGGVIQSFDQGGYVNPAPGASKGGGPGAGTHSRSNRGYVWQDDDAYDLMAPRGNPNLPVYAAFSGVVSATRPFNSDPAFWGHGLYLQGGGGQLFYKHLRTLDVKAGQRVTAGQRLGTLGDGVNGGSHLHLGASPLSLLSQVVNAPARTSPVTSDEEIDEETGEGVGTAPRLSPRAQLLTTLRAAGFRRGTASQATAGSPGRPGSNGTVGVLPTAPVPGLRQRATDVAGRIMGATRAAAVEEAGQGADLTETQTRRAALAGRRAAAAARAAGLSPDAVADARREAERKSEIKQLKGIASRNTRRRRKLAALRGKLYRDLDKLRGMKRRAPGQKKAAAKRIRLAIKGLTEEINELIDLNAEIRWRLGEIGDEMAEEEYQEGYEDPATGEEGDTPDTGPASLTPDQQALNEQREAQAAVDRGRADASSSFLRALGSSGSIDPATGGVNVNLTINGSLVHQQDVASFVVDALYGQPSRRSPSLPSGA